MRDFDFLNKRRLGPGGWGHPGSGMGGSRNVLIAFRMGLLRIGQESSEIGLMWGDFA